MHSLHFKQGIITALLMSMALAPFAFADNDNDNRGKSKSKDDDKKSWMSLLPFTTIGTTTDSLMTQIKSLQESLARLKAEREALDDNDDDDENNSASSTKSARDALKTDIKETKNELKQAEKQLKFARSLVRGMRGDDVRDLQELLAQDPTLLTSDMITGFFGPKTEEALRKFQRKHGIDAIGIFGPKSQAKILALFAGRELPPGIIKRLGLENSSTTPGSGIVTICHKPIGTTPQSLVIAVPALGGHLNHGDTVGVCAGSGSATTTDTTAPSLSNISATGITINGATITWNTNESATTQVEYGTTTSYGSQSTLNTTLSTGHSVLLSSLQSGMLYNFRVMSKDAAGNTATSGNMTFTTGALDVTGPVISNILINNIAATSATVSWNTNEQAFSKIYFATSSPVNLATASSLTNASSALSHSFNLTGLSASSTYYVILESKDASNNVSTSSQQSFLTL